ncbi:MAG: sigma-70 family RNA polymerase sigma factor [Chloroflexota bacterium]|nr:sigma-70 family RNA polymerase sigma factor [Chloroflexota bacterium]
MPLSFVVAYARHFIGQAGPPIGYTRHRFGSVLPDWQVQSAPRRVRHGKVTFLARQLSTLQELEDAELVDRARKRDRKAFSELVRRHQDAVYRVCYRVLGDAHDAEDASQDAFLRAYDRLDSFQGRSAFRTWALRLAVNVSLNLLERRRSAESLSEDSESPWPGPEAEVVRLEAASEVHSALQQLPPNHRVAVVLRDLEGESYREIADHLDVPEGTVKGWVHRGRRRLKELLT